MKYRRDWTRDEPESQLLLRSIDEDDEIDDEEWEDEDDWEEDEEEEDEDEDWDDEDEDWDDWDDDDEELKGRHPGRPGWD